MSEEIEKLKLKIEECERQSAEYLAGWQRAKADLINYKREVSDERLRWVDGGKEEVIKKMIKTLDNWHEALNHVDSGLEKDKWVSGVKHIMKELEETLKHEGLAVCGEVGEDFNPEFHEAAGIEKSQEKPGKISRVLQRGYLYNKKLLRPARVIISE